MKALIAYATTHGHTAKIAARLAEALRREGLEVDARDLGQHPDVRPQDYDAAILAGSLHGARHQDEVVDWVRAHHTSLTALPTLFCSASLTAAEDSDEARAATRDCIDEFVEDTDWTPDHTEAIAGALQYREYDVFTRILLRLIVRRAGHPEPDTSHDHDYTDWERVDRIGAEFAQRVQAAQPG